MKHRIVQQVEGESAGQWLHVPEFHLESPPVNVPAEVRPSTSDQQCLSVQASRRELHQFRLHLVTSNV